MNCSDCRDGLLLHFNQAETLPAEILHHLQSCGECRHLYEQLEVIGGRLGDNADFMPDGLTEDEFVAAVERRIDRLEPSRVTWIGWRRYLPVAAAILLVLGITLVGYRQVRIGYNGGNAKETAEVYDQGSLLWALYDTEAEEIDDDVFDLILSDFVTKGYFEAGELLLDDLTEEELQYLEENLDVRGIL